MTSNETALPPRKPANCCAPRWRAAPIWLACAWALSSCALGTRPTAAAPIPAEVLALLAPMERISPDLKAPCPSLPLAADDALDTLARNHWEVTALYDNCAAGKYRLGNAVDARDRLEAERIERAQRALDRQRER